MVKIQYIKLKIDNYCCTSGVKNRTSIVEWCIMDRNEFLIMIGNELKFNKYAEDSKSLKRLQNAVLSEGRVRNVGCDNCMDIYLFQSVKSKLSDDNFVNGKKYLELNSNSIKNIEQVAIGNNIINN
jgi:hypothetical protein